MEILDLLIRYFIAFTCTYYIALKITNNRKMDFLQIIFISLVSSIIITIFKSISLQLLSYLFSLTTISIYYKFKNEKSFKYSFFIMLVSYTICFIIYSLFAVITISSLIYIINHHTQATFLEYRIADLITILLIYKLFNLNKFKNGVTFFKEEEKIENMGTITLACIITILCSILLWEIMYSSVNHTKIKYYFAWVMFFMIALIIFYIKRESTNHFKTKANGRTIDNLNNTIEEKDKQLFRLSELASINHSINHELDILKARFKEENLNDLYDETNKLSKRYSKLVEKNSLKGLLQSTHIEEIDKVLLYMNNLCRDNNINFIIRINGNIKEMVDNYVDINTLSTLLSDLIKNATIAVRHSKNNYKSITVIIGEIFNTYGVAVHDTGIEFKLETLKNLGTKASTTHKSEGGTGIGFITIFKTLKRTKGSIIIEERKPKPDNYTKSITILFDNQKDFNILSYREEKLINREIILNKKI